MNKANKITMSRIVMSVIIIILLLFPFDQVGFEFPTYLIRGNVLVDLKYIIVGVLFVIASLTDFFDGIITIFHRDTQPRKDFHDRLLV